MQRNSVTRIYRENKTGVKDAIGGNQHKYLRLDIDIFKFSLIVYLFHILNSTNIPFTTTDTKVTIINELQTGTFFGESTVLTLWTFGFTDILHLLWDENEGIFMIGQCGEKIKPRNPGNLPWKLSNIKLFSENYVSVMHMGHQKFSDRKDNGGQLLLVFYRTDTYTIMN